MESQKNLTNFIYSAYSFVCLAKSLGLAWFWKELPPQIPWFYTLPWGENQLTSRMFFVYVILAELLIGLGLYLWSKKTKSVDEKTKVTVAGGVLLAVVMEALSFINVLGIYQ